MPADKPNERLRVAHEELSKRGFRQVSGEAKLHNAGVTGKARAYLGPIGFVFLVVYEGDAGSWDLYVPAHVGNSIPATWAALDALLAQTGHAPSRSNGDAPADIDRITGNGEPPR